MSLAKVTGAVEVAADCAALVWTAGGAGEAAADCQPAGNQNQVCNRRVAGFRRHESIFRPVFAVSRHLSSRLTGRDRLSTLRSVANAGWPGARRQAHCKCSADLQVRRVAGLKACTASDLCSRRPEGLHHDCVVLQVCGVLSVVVQTFRSAIVRKELSMTTRALASAGTLAAVIALVGMSSAGQAAGSGLQRRSLKSPASRAEPEARKPYVVPRTPWGDPDLQGNLTNLYEVGTPVRTARSVRGPAARGCQRRGIGQDTPGDRAAYQSGTTGR